MSADPPVGEAGLRGHESQGWRRRGLLAIPHAHLGPVLGLPPFITPLFVHDDVLRGRVVVLAESDVFPEVAPGNEPPTIGLNALYDRAGDLVRWDTGDPLVAQVEPGGYSYERWARIVDEADERTEELRDIIELAIHAHGDALAVDVAEREGRPDNEAGYRAFIDRLFTCAAERGLAPAEMVAPGDGTALPRAELAAKTALADAGIDLNAGDVAATIVRALTGYLVDPREVRDLRTYRANFDHGRVFTALTAAAAGADVEALLDRLVNGSDL